MNLPLFPPETDWAPPRVEDLPDRLHGVVGIDLETRDDGIQAGQGSGWAWQGGGYVVGYAVAAENFSTYLPIRHEGGGNLDPDQVRRWLRHVLRDPDQPKVGANVVLYDAGWWETDGLEVPGPLYDVQWTEALLDDHRASYALNSLARSRLSREKNETKLREAARSFGVDPKADMWRLPSTFVGAYAAQDAVLAREILAAQLPEVAAQDLRRVFDLEHALGPMYRDLRRRGVRVDVPRVERLLERYRRGADELLEEIRRRTGVRVDLWAADSLAKAFDAEGLPYGRTPKTNRPSITKELLGSLDHWLPKAVLAARRQHKLASTFLEGVILGNLHGDRVHGELHPLRFDDDEDSAIQGAVTGRISMSHPNLTFIPTRTEEGKEIRRCFLPEEGELWTSPDVSQQEPRLLVHFACLTPGPDGEPLPGAFEVRDRYRADPDLSYHELVAEIAGLPYDRAKVLNLARIYGRGVHNTANELGVSAEDVKEIFRRHAEALPFAAEMAKLATKAADRRGYVRSLLGRRSRFPNYELKGEWDEEAGRFVRPTLSGTCEEDRRTFPLWKARRVWPGKKLQRARLHKALNAIIQPSAADWLKSGMLEAWRSGLGRHVLFQVYDELPASVPDEATAARLAECLRDAVSLEVPAKVEYGLGPNWGDSKT